jgi:hypothetical protein
MMGAAKTAVTVQKHSEPNFIFSRLQVVSAGRSRSRAPGDDLIDRRP